LVKVRHIPTLSQAHRKTSSKMSGFNLPTMSLYTMTL
jgi:hypothetical protein